MIILFSILLLAILVYIGMTQKEGMTLNDSGSLLTILNKYYKFEKKNKDDNIDNTKNENLTMDAITELSLTDPSIKSVVENTDLNNSSKINMLNTYIKRKIGTESNSITPDQFNKIVSILTTVNDPNEQVIEIKNITINDPRFHKLFNGETNDIITNIKKQLINMLNA